VVPVDRVRGDNIWGVVGDAKEYGMCRLHWWASVGGVVGDSAMVYHWYQVLLR